MRGLILLAFACAGMAHARDPYASGKTLIAAQCASCHVVPGVANAVGRVGPSLRGIARQRMLAGRLPNTPDNMARWIMHPQAIDRGNAMPDMGLNERQARAITAYLETLEGR